MGPKLCLAQELGEGSGGEGRGAGGGGGGWYLGDTVETRDYFLPTLKKAPNNTNTSR